MRWRLRHYVTLAASLSGLLILVSVIDHAAINNTTDPWWSEGSHQPAPGQLKHRNGFLISVSNMTQMPWERFDVEKYLSPQKLPRDPSHSAKYSKYQFNQEASDTTSVDRPIPDVRADACKKTYFTTDVPPTSVIITFHNEARSALLRTVVSVLRTSPPNLLQEIILVDDYSDDPKDGQLLSVIEKVRVIRNDKREGLIRSRVKGAKAAIAPVLTFLDSHCECVKKWLEPLLIRVQEDPTRVVSPVIDVINMDTFQYTVAASNLKGGFSWSMVFKWDYLNEQEERKHSKDKTQAIRTPVMAGGLFSVNKNRFFEIGAYDEQMDVWGGENLELSLRVWQCGGSLEIVPCSRVGHVFRKQHPYSFPGGKSEVFLKNTRRMVEVWLDRYSEQYYREVPSARTVSFGDIGERKKLRKDLKCQSFQWYIDNVYPELNGGAQSARNDRYGKIEQNSRCLFALSTNTSQQKDVQTPRLHWRAAQLRLDKCYNGESDDGSQDWTLAVGSSGLVRVGDQCLSATGTKPGDKVFLQRCQPAARLQKWMLSKISSSDNNDDELTKNTMFRMVDAPLCLDSDHYRSEGGAALTVDACEAARQSQRWRIVDVA